MSLFISARMQRENRFLICPLFILSVKNYHINGIDEPKEEIFKKISEDAMNSLYDYIFIYFMKPVSNE